MMDIPTDCRYNTIWSRPGLGGFVILKDNKNGMDEEIIEALKPTSKFKSVSGNEVSFVQMCH